MKTLIKFAFVSAILFSTWLAINAWLPSLVRETFTIKGVPFAYAVPVMLGIAWMAWKRVK
jgi:hypothetical protein